MKFLIAGYGSIGRRHFRNLIALGEQDILFLRSKRSALPDDEIAGFPVERDVAAALKHGPDAVIVANPTALHLDVAIPAAEAGCHLFLEKPISHSFERMEELENSVNRGGGQVFVGFQFRFHPGLQKIKYLLEKRVIGSPLSVRVHWGEYLPGWHPWEDYRQGYSARKDLGGGVVLTLCHPLDYLRWLLGDVQSLWAFMGRNSDLEMDVEDTAEVGLHFENGVIGSVHLNYTQRPPVHRLEIVCSGGSILWNNSTGAVTWYDAKADIWQDFLPPSGFERNQLFVAEMAHFVDVVHGQELSICTLKDGIRALELALGIHTSAHQGKLINFKVPLEPRPILY